MELKCILQGAVLCVLLFTVNCDVKDKSRRKRCRCNKYIEQMNKDIDKRLKAFETRFEQNFLKLSTDQRSKNTTLSIASEHKIDSLTEDMNKTRDRLRKESYSLRRIQDNMYSQEVTVENLSVSFKSLDTIVRNLSKIVEHLEHSMRSALEQKPQHTKSHKRRHDNSLSPTINPGPSTPMTYPKDCDEVYQSGGMRFLGDYFIMVQPKGATTPFKTVCKILDGAGWTVIQRRQDGRENFSRNWEEYKTGFGDLQHEFWLGNEKLHLLTTQGDYELKIDMEEWNGKKHYAQYDHFKVSSENDQFRLHVSGYRGNAGDSLTPYWRSHDGMPFSTYDRDNDNRIYDNCAVHYGGGWWYNDCFETHLNGKYYQNGTHNNYFIRNGIQWNSIHSYSSLKFVEIMIKPTHYQKLPNNI